MGCTPEYSRLQYNRKIQRSFNHGDGGHIGRYDHHLYKGQQAVIKGEEGCVKNEEEST